ncbi:MAG: pyruvate dehydrogenase (acetyl-transferring), homodimeric type, partial [Terriglobia bacterium]
MIETAQKEFAELENIERKEWLESLDYVIQQGDTRRVRNLLGSLRNHAIEAGIPVASAINTPYINTIPASQQAVFPGDREMERRIKSLVRWNAMAMVVRANRSEEGIGGHISTYASAATLYEIGMNHFFRGANKDHEADVIFFQGHASPGMYARAFVEGRLPAKLLENFRRELLPGGGLPSYPHPWLMPDFWQFPTVSMGLGPLMAVYQARFLRYLEDRGLKNTAGTRVWAFVGDGEVDEPETLAGLSLAARTKLDNLIFVINCNLQRLDGPVRSNGNIIQELEAVFLGASWNVIKVIWGSDWDPLLAQDRDGMLMRRMGEVVDGERQKYSVESGQYFRHHFFGGDPRLLELVKDIPDDQLAKLRLGGHDPEKVYAAYKV